MEIYLIAGKSGSGKGQVADIIYEYYTGAGKKALITEYSKYLKMYAEEIIAWDTNTEKPRKFLQDTGVLIKDKIGDNDFLVRRMLEDLRLYEMYFDVVIISDVRFPEEIDLIKKNYNKTYSIYLINQFAASTLSLEEQIHITETALESYTNFDITIANDDINSLDNKVLRFIESEK